MNVGAVIVKGLTAAVVNVVATVFTQSFFERIAKKLIIILLDKLSKMSKTTVDDKIVLEVKKQLNEGE